MTNDPKAPNAHRLNLRGRGAVSNDSGRFNRSQTVPDLNDVGYMDEDDVRTLKTEFLPDHSRTIIASNDSPDIPFTYSINPYRGCEHGCIYCYARPTHEYFGLSAGFDFESKIFVKEKAPELLHEKLMSKSWKPEMIAISGVTDCYQPAERKFELTRRCLEVLAKFKNPVGVITKNALITRDLDILGEMAREDLASVFISITTLDTELARTMEPRTSSPRARLQTIEALAKAGVPVGVNVAPVIPGLTDHEMPTILKAAAEAGASSAGFVPLRLPYSVKKLFEEWLATHRPERKDKVLGEIRDLRGGELNQTEFGQRMQGEGAKADHLAQMFQIFRKKYFEGRKAPRLRTDLFQRPGDQLSFF